MAQSQQEIRKRAKEHKDNRDWAAAVALYEEIYSPRCDRCGLLGNTQIA